MIGLCYNYKIFSGALFASKAFVQLAINPMVGTVTARFGYSAPLMCGTATLLLSALSKDNVDNLVFEQ